MLIGHVHPLDVAPGLPTRQVPVRNVVKLISLPAYIVLSDQNLQRFAIFLLFEETKLIIKNTFGNHATRNGRSLRVEWLASAYDDGRIRLLVLFGVSSHSKLLVGLQIFNVSDWRALVAG